MVRIMMGLVAAIVIVAGGFFGFQFYAQHRAEAEVEAAFAQIRAAGGKASHGKVSFDLSTRTVTVADITSESASPAPVNVKIASFKASGASRSDTTRFSADTIEATDMEIGVSMAALLGGRVVYKAPRITVKDYSGPASLQLSPAAASNVDMYRSAIEQFMRVSASSVTIPTITGTMNLEGAVPGGGAGDFTYSDLSMQGIKDGKIAVMKADGFAFAVTMQQAGKPQKMTGNLAAFAAYDFDASGAAAALDPQKATENQYYRAYRQVSTGAYTIASEPGVRMRIDGITIDDVGVRPSRIQLPALLAVMPPAGTAAPTPAQTREMMDKAAGIYEGVRIGNAEMRGLTMEMPQGPMKLQAMRFNLENGRIGEFAFEGFDAVAPKGPVKLQRFALKSLDLANLLRMSAQFSDPAQRPSPEQALGMLALLEGAELKGLSAPFKNTGKPVTIDAIDLSWGQFVGPIPSRVRVSAKMAGPVDATDPTQMPLVIAGIDRLALDLDLGAAWTEGPRTFVLDPVTLELGGLLKATARVLLANVPREVFSLNQAQATSKAAEIDAGTLEFALRDLGAVDLAIAQFARAQNISRDMARRAAVDILRANGEKLIAGPNPDVVAVLEAMIRLIENPGQTLIVKVTPRGKVPALQLLQLWQTDPAAALAQFRIEASTGL